MTSPFALERAAALSGLKVADLIGPSVDPAICRVRYAVMYAMSAHGLSLATIGRLLRRHHTTVLSGLRRADEYAVSDPSFIELVEAIG